MISITTLALLFTSALVAAAPTPDDAVLADSAAPSARISSITFSGNGCARDPKFTGGFNDPTFTFHNFAASLPGMNQTLNCAAHITATGAGAGWQVALKENVVHGRVVLSPGTSLDYYTTVFFSENASKTTTAGGTLSNREGTGSIDRAVGLRSTLGSNKVWSACTGSSGYPGILNVNFRGALTGDGGKAYFEALTENLEFEWRRC